MTKMSATKVVAGQVVSCKYLPPGRFTVLTTHTGQGINQKTVWMTLADSEGNKLERRIAGKTYPAWGFAPNTRFDIY